MASRYTNATLNNGLNGTRRNPVREALSPTEMLRDGTLGGVFGGLSYTGSVQYPFGKPPQTRGEYNTQKAWIEKAKKYCDEDTIGKVDKQKVSNPVDLPEDQLIQQADDAALDVINGARRTESYGLDIDNLKFSKTVESHTGRPYQDSKLTIKEIIESSAPSPDPRGTGALSWNVEGSFNGSSGQYELIIDPQSNTVWHYVFKSK